MKKRIKEYTMTSYKKIIISFIIYLLLEPFLFNLFEDSILEIKFDFSFLLFILILIVLIFYVVESVKRMIRCYRPNDNIFIFSGVLVIVCFYYKFGLSPYINTLFINGLYEVKIILYLLIIFPIFQILLKVYNDLLRFFNVPNKNKPAHSSLIDYDTHPKKDLFSRKQFAERIANELKIINKKKSISIGILGHWGEGKTTVLEYIEKNVGDDFIILKFNPWKSSSPKSIKEDFFSLLKEKISYYDGRASSQIDSYINALSLSLSNVGVFNKLLFVERDQETLFKEVEESIINLPKRVLVFIDDLDRLDKKEVKETIKLVRNYANFSNCTFIVAYDKDRITKSLRYKNKAGENSYLEKIFQVEIVLPKIFNGILADELKTRLIDLFPNFENEIFDFIRQESTNSVANQYIGKISHETLVIGGVIKNLRDVVRLCNSLVFSLKSDDISNIGIEGEVNFTEYLYLEIIKMKSISVYDKLKMQSFVENNSGTLKFNDTEFNVVYENIPFIDTLSKNQVFTLLNKLFGSQKTDSLQRSITVPSFFPAFFTSIIDGQFSIVEFSKIRQETEKSEQNLIIKYLSDKINKVDQNEIKLLFHSINSFDNRSDFENIVESFIFLHVNGLDMFSKIVNLLSINKIKNIVKSNTLANVEEANCIVKNLFDTYGDNIEVADLIHSIIRSQLSMNEPFIIPLKELQELALKNFKTYAFSNKTIDKYTLAYFGACISSIDPGTRKFKIDSSAIEYFKENKNKFPFQYMDLRRKVGNSTRGPLFGLNLLLKEIFGSWDSFYEFINSQDDVDKEFLELMEKFRENKEEPLVLKDGKYIQE